MCGAVPRYCDLKKKKEERRSLDCASGPSSRQGEQRGWRGTSRWIEQGCVYMGNFEGTEMNEMCRICLGN